MSKAAVIGAVVVGIGVVGGGGYYYASQQAEKKFQEKITLLKGNFPGSTLTYENHHINLFSQETTLDKVVFNDKNGNIYTADKVDAIVGPGDVISKLAIDKFAIKDKRDVGFTIGHIDLTDATAEPGWIVRKNGQIRQIFPSKISFGLLDLQNIEIGESKSSKFKLAQYQIKNYGLGKKTDTVLKDLYIIDRRNDLKIGSIKIDQANQAEISKNIEEMVNNNNSKSFEVIFKKTLQNLAEIQFNLFSIDNFQFIEKYDVTLKIGHYEFKDYGFGRKSSQLLKDFSVTDFDRRDGFIKVALVDLNGIDIASLIKVYQGLDLSNGYDAIIASATKCKEEYIKLVGDQKSNMKIAGLEALSGQEKISLGVMSASSQINAQGAGDATYTVDNLEFTLPPYNRNTQFLKDLGYKQIAVSGVLKVQYQTDTKSLLMSLDKLTFKDIGQVSATFKANIPLDLNYNKPEIALMNPDVKFKEFTLNVQDLGLVERAIEKISKEQGVSKEEVKKSLVLQAQEGVENLRKLNPAFASDVVKAFENLINDPQKTEIEVTSLPTTPITAASIEGKDKQEIFNLFNLKVQAASIK